MAYNIKIRTKEGTFEYEKEDLNDLDLILIKHPTYEEMRAEQKKEHCDKCKIELNETFIQHWGDRTYKLCKNCNEYYMKLQDNIRKVKRREDNKQDRLNKRTNR